MFAYLLSAASPATAQVPPTERAQWEDGQRSDQAFYRRQFIEYGFVPIEEIDLGKRDVRRLLLRDPYSFLPIPGVEYERRAGGKVTMRLHYGEYRTAPVAIPKAAWDRIVAGEKAMFAPTQFVPVKRDPAAGVPPVCHGWMIIAQASGDRAASWWECRDRDGAKAAAARTMIEVALATRPDCKSDEDPRWAFQKCFGEKDVLDDPALNEPYVSISKELKDSPGATLLAAARKALQAPDLTLGSPAWREAREAVRKVLENQAARRAALQKLSALDYRARDASDPDKVKMRRAIRHWSEFIAGQEANDVDLLRRLAWAGQ